jgi:hypothetical protein
MKRLMPAILISLVTAAASGCADEAPEAPSSNATTKGLPAIPPPPDPNAEITVTAIRGSGPDQTIVRDTMKAGDAWRLITQPSAPSSETENGVQSIRGASVIEACWHGSQTYLWDKPNYSGNLICLNGTVGTADLWSAIPYFWPRSAFSAMGVNFWNTTHYSIILAWCSGGSNSDLSSLPPIRYVSSPASAQGPCHF